MSYLFRLVHTTFFFNMLGNEQRKINFQDLRLRANQEAGQCSQNAEKANSFDKNIISRLPAFHRFKLHQVGLTCFLARTTFIWHTVTIQIRGGEEMESRL